jgi:hypothetical protein
VFIITASISYGLFRVSGSYYTLSIVALYLLLPPLATMILEKRKS